MLYYKDMKITGIYKIESKINKTRFYVGSAVNMKKRWSTHAFQLRHNKHHSTKLQNHYNKYGKDDLTFIILELCLNEFLLIREQYYLDLLNPYFNTCKIAGNTLGYKYSKKIIDKIQESRKGYVPTQETKNKISKSLIGNKRSLGYKQTDETKAKISKKTKGKNNPRYGVKLSEETKRKISEKAKGRIPSEEAIKNMRIANTGSRNGFFGKKHSEETKRKISESKKKLFSNIGVN